jgi:hypothetical protein
MFFRKNGFSLALIVSWILREQKTKTFLTSVKELYTLYAHCTPAPKNVCEVPVNMTFHRKWIGNRRRAWEYGQDPGKHRGKVRIIPVIPNRHVQLRKKAREVKAKRCFHVWVAE